MAESTILQPIQTHTWVKATWDEFVAISTQTQYESAQAYYHHSSMRLEMAPLGSAHGQDNSLISTVVTLYGLAKNLPIKELINTSFRQPGTSECQPDLAYYIGSSLPTLPRNNAPIDIQQHGAPTLIVEIGATSFSDDLGAKRLLYETFGIQEYWVVNANTQDIIAFEMAAGRSGRIEVSQVLPDLPLSLIQEALQRSLTDNTSRIGRWLLQAFGNP